jgi:hypothetical protein
VSIEANGDSQSLLVFLAWRVAREAAQR